MVIAHCDVTTRYAGDNLLIFTILMFFFIEIGGPLHLSAVWTDNNVVNVSCWSKGWYPKPYLRWSDQKGALTPEIIQHAEESSGLLSVHSWALVNSSSEIICTLGLQDGEEKQSRLHLSKLPQNGQRDSNRKVFLLIISTATQKLTHCLYLDSATAGLAALAVVLVITTTILGIAFYKIRGKDLLGIYIMVNSTEIHDSIKVIGVFVF